MHALVKSAAKVALRAFPFTVRLELACRIQKKSLSSGPFGCNVCGAKFREFRPRSTADDMRRAYALPERIDPYDNPLDRARGNVRRICPQCGEAERERFLFYLLDRLLLPESRVLHAAAGVFAQRNLRARCRYV